MSSKREFFTKNKILISIFFIATAFFLVQHYFEIDWDFAAYVINARYFFQGSDYLEVYRAPLASLILGSFLIFGKLGEYLSLLLISSLFFIANIALSRALFDKYFNKYKISKETFVLIFYLISLNGFVLYYGTLLGTELLSLAFLELFLAAFLRNKVSGHYLGLAILSRYNLIAFAIFLIFNRNYKKILKNILALLAILTPWLLYNYIKWGNLFTSIADSYYLNVLSRTQLAESFNFYAPIIMANIFFPLVIIGLAISLKKIISALKKKDYQSISILGIFILISAMILLDYSTTPFKITRYLFNLTLPIAFFSALAVTSIINKKTHWKKTIKMILIAVFIIAVIISFTISFERKNEKEMIYQAALTIKELELEQCLIRSPYWIPVAYYTKNVFNLLSIEDSLYKNEAVLIFPCCSTIDDTFKMNELDKYNYIYKSKNHILIANKNFSADNCRKKQGWDTPMKSNSCEILSNAFKFQSLKELSQKLCETINPKK